MPIRLIIFGVLQLLVLAYACRVGRAPERLAAASTMLALVAGWAVPFNPWTAYQHVEIGQFSIDVALLVGLLILACLADRFWPIWLAAFQVLAVALHGVRAYDPDLLPLVYNRLVGWLGYPMLAIITGGIWRLERRRKKIGSSPRPDLMRARRAAGEQG